MQLAFSDSDFARGIFYTQKSYAKDNLRIWRFLFEMIPSYTFSLIFGNITDKAVTNFNLNTMSWQPPTGFTWDDYYNQELRWADANSDYLVIQPVSYFIGRLQINMLVNFCLIWYLDHVLASNRGVAYSMTFPFQKSYWLSIIEPFQKKSSKTSPDVRHKKKRVISKKDIGLTGESATLESVKVETEKVLEDEEKDVACLGLRVVGIEKTYYKLPFGLKSKKDVHAVKGVYMNIDRNELVCLLGHNGAGKSTLFNMLTGIIGPTQGYAKICGYDIRQD